jgi:hypothetical protein
VSGLLALDAPESMLPHDGGWASVVQERERKEKEQGSEVEGKKGILVAFCLVLAIGYSGEMAGSAVSVRGQLEGMLSALEKGCR